MLNSVEHEKKFYNLGASLANDVAKYMFSVGNRKNHPKKFSSYINITQLVFVEYPQIVIKEELSILWFSVDTP